MDFDILSCPILKTGRYNPVFFTYRIEYSITNHILQFGENGIVVFFNLLKSEENDSLLYIPIVIVNK